MQQNPQAKEIVTKNFKVAREDIVLIKAILESYEGMVVVRTVEGSPNILELLIAADFEDFLEPILRELQGQVSMEFMESPAPPELGLAT